jgi:hypothetical protein
MSNDSAAGLSLGISTLALLATMAMHPTGHDVVQGAASTLHRNAAVHTMAILAMPLALYGLLVLTRRLTAPNLPWIALLFYALACAAGMCAAVASGFIAPKVADDAVLFHYTGLLNQGFALVFVLAASIAIVLWSIALLRQIAWLGVLGLIVGTLTFLAVGSGHVRLNVHGFGAVVVAHAVWMVCVAVVLARGTLATGEAAP